MDKISVLKFEVTKPPVFKEVRGKDWIYWGEKNDYPDYLIDLATKSARHGAILSGKINFILGKGLAYNPKGLTDEQKAITENFIKFFKDKDKERLIVQDFEYFNGFAFEVIWNKKLSKPVELNPIPRHKIRTNANQSLYFYSDNWKARLQDEKETGYKVFEPFDINNPKVSQLFVFNILTPKKTGECNVYPVAEYQSGCIAIETDIHVANFDNSNLSSGFTAGTIVNFNNGTPANATAKKAIEDQVKDKTAGSENAGQVIISFNNGKDKETTVTTLTPSDLDKQNIEVDKRTEQRIFTAHKVSDPTLFGVKSEGVVFEKSVNAQSYELFQSTYVDLRQQAIESVINKFAKIFGVQTSLFFERVNPVKQGIDQATLSAAYTQNEIRAELGLPVIEVKQGDNAKDIIAALNSLSPLVATKVLETMTDQEIRNLIGLKADGQVGTQLNATKNVSEIFSSYGRKRCDFEIIKSREFEFTSNDETVISEFKFKSELNSLQKSIIDLIGKNEKISIDELSKALKETPKVIKTTLSDLIDNEYVKPSTHGHTPTTLGYDVLDTEKVKTENFEVLYGYDWRAGFSNSDEETSRDFCKELLEKDLLYTRAEIDLMKNDLGSDVWTYKGGWYTKPNTDVHLPYCRHTWHQYLVKKK